MHAGSAPCNDRPRGLPVLTDKTQDELESLIALVGQLHEKGDYLLPYKVLGWNVQRNYWEVEEIFPGGPVETWLEEKLQLLSKNKKEKEDGC